MTCGPHHFPALAQAAPSPTEDFQGVFGPVGRAFLLSDFLSLTQEGIVDLNLAISQSASFYFDPSVPAKA